MSLSPHLLHRIDSLGEGVRVDFVDLVLADVELPDTLVLQDGGEHGLRLLLVRLVEREQPDSPDRPQPGGVEEVHVGHLDLTHHHLHPPPQPGGLRYHPPLPADQEDVVEVRPGQEGEDLHQHLLGQRRHGDSLRNHLPLPPRLVYLDFEFSQLSPNKLLTETVGFVHSKHAADFQPQD